MIGGWRYFHWQLIQSPIANGRIANCPIGLFVL